MNRFTAWIANSQLSRWTSHLPWRAFVFIGALWTLFWGGHQRSLARSNDAAIATIVASAPTSPQPIGMPLAPTCEMETIQVKLNPVCPLGGEQDTDLVALESAKRPLLAIEMREYPKNSVVANSRVSRDVFFAAAGLPMPGLRKEAPSEIVARVDLTKENLVTPQFQKEISLVYPAAGQGKRMLAVMVCDDTNNDGRCSDEKHHGQISVRSPVHQACTLPRQIPIAVRAGCH